MTNRCVTRAAKNTPTVPAIGAITSPPTNARKPWSPLAPNSQVTPPGTLKKVSSPTRTTETSMQIKANTSGPRTLPCRGSPAKKAAGWNTTRDDVYEAVERIGEVVVSSRGGSGSHIHAPSLLMYPGGAALLLYWRARADATRVAPSRLYSPECVEGEFLELLRLCRILRTSPV